MRQNRCYSLEIFLRSHQARTAKATAAPHCDVLGMTRACTVHARCEGEPCRNNAF
jgi:hypothetical protein